MLMNHIVNIVNEHISPYYMANYMVHEYETE